MIRLTILNHEKICLTLRFSIFKTDCFFCERKEKTEA